jgi:hypothetical protein
MVIVETPSLYATTRDAQWKVIDNGTSSWSGLHAKVGQVYDPSTEWASIHIPADHYQTIVSIRGAEVLNAPGTRFHKLPPAIAAKLTITSGMRPEDIVTSIYWRPMGTSDPSHWVLLLSNQSGSNARIQPSVAMAIE